MVYRFAKHEAVGTHVKDVVASWGLDMVPTSRDYAANTMTAIYFPQGMAPADVSVFCAHNKIAFFSPCKGLALSPCPCL